jgi:hypothetical protein
VKISSHRNDETAACHAGRGKRLPSRHFHDLGPGPAQLSGSPRSFTAPIFVETLLLSVMVTSALLFLQWGYGFNWTDEGILWYGSQRTALGQVPLRDFFSYDPGRYYWSAFIFKTLRGNGLFEQIVANYCFGMLGLVVAYLAMSKAMLGRRWRILILVLLGIMLGFPRHKIYEQTLSLVAMAGIVLLLANPAKLNYWFSFGVAAGLAAFIGRNSGLYFVIAALLLLVMLKISGERIFTGRTLGAFSSGVAVGYLPMLFMLCFVNGFAPAFFRSMTQLTSNRQLKLPIPFPWHVPLQNLHGVDVMQARAVSILCLVVPITYGLLVLGWLKSKGNWDRALQLACAASVAGLPYLHHAFSRADFPHIAQGVVPFALAIGAVSQHLWKVQKPRLALACLAGLTVLVLACWLPREPLIEYLRVKTRHPEMVEQIGIAGRKFEVATSEADVMRVVRTAFVRCGAVEGSFLAMPYYPGLYAFLNTRAPFWELFYFYRPSDEFERAHIEALEKNATALVLLNQDATIDGTDTLKIGQTNPQLAQYILDNFQPSGTKLPKGFELYYLPGKCELRLAGS